MARLIHKGKRSYAIAGTLYEVVRHPGYWAVLCWGEKTGGRYRTRRAAVACALKMLGHRH